ncbi:MAG: hypothetical protein WC310_00585 [Patescibacteria group bacterium]|jgi:uncharacterized protein YpmS
MTRVENNFGSQSVDSKELQKMIREEAGSLRPKVIKKRPFFGCCNCFGLVVVIVLVVAGYGAAATAKTGLIKIPVFSDIFYKQPQPVRAIEIVSGLTSVPVNSLVSGQANKDLIFKENDLSAILNNSLQELNKQQNNLFFDSAQVAIEEDRIEVFVKIQKPKEIYLTIDFLPQVEAGKPKLKIKDLKIGVLKIPTSISSVFFDQKINEEVEKIFGNLPIVIKEVVLERGKMIMRFDIDQSKLKNDVIK